jgi:DNA modification methylase
MVDSVLSGKTDRAVICVDCLDILPTIPDESIDCIFTDPPYNISQKASIKRNGGKYGVAADIDLDFGEWDNAWESETEYLQWCEKWLNEFSRVIKPDCHVLFFFSWLLGHPINEIAKPLGLRMRQPLFWVKSNPAPRYRKVDFMKSHETILWFTKGASKQDHFNWNQGQQLDYVTAAIPHSEDRHPTEKAVLPIKTFLSYLTKPGDVVLDPFFGSGSVGVAALSLQRRIIGIEVSQDYCKKAEERLNPTSEDNQLPF